MGYSYGGKVLEEETLFHYNQNSGRPQKSSQSLIYLGDEDRPKQGPLPRCVLEAEPSVRSVLTVVLTVAIYQQCLCASGAAR